MFPGQIAESTPDKPAVIMAGSGAVQTYAELDAAANRLAHLLWAHGLRPGDHIAMCLENHPSYFELAWAAQYTGLIYTACSSRLTPEELAYIVNDCGAKVFIGSARHADLAEAIVADTPNVGLRILVGGSAPGHLRYEEAVADQPSTPHASDRVEGTDMLYSSGTTGRPKGVATPLPDAPLGTHTGVSFLAQALFGFDDSIVYISPAPLYHAAPLRFTLAVHRLGGTVVAMESFDAERCLATIETYKVTHGQFVPTMFIRMLKLGDEVRARYDLSSLQFVFHAAAPCPIGVKQQMIEWFGPIIHEYYAGTEGNGFVYCNSEDWLAHPGTVGKSIIGKVHVCAEDGSEQPTGESGTVWFEGGGAFEYHNDPEKTRASQNDRGWSTLGDVGYLDEDEFLHLTDRKAYMIITGGVNVYPQEAENVLAMHPKVADVAVLGIPNDDFGEEVKAVVQPVEGVTTGPDLEAELIAYCRSHLADVKCPRSVDFRDELPRHPTGKLYKRLLKDEYWAAAGRRI